MPPRQSALNQGFSGGLEKEPSRGKDLDIKHDLAEMLPAGLILEGGNDVVQWEVPVDDGP